MRKHIRALFDFESNSYAGWQVIGEAFGARPTLANSSKRQATMLCTEGRYVASSFHPERGDQARGELRSPEFVVDRGHLSLLVGGGAHTRAELRVEGQRVRVASGPGSEILHEVVWDVRELRGLAAQLVAVDDDVHAGGHIVVDYVALFDDGG
jgi:hypothetical protein